jgi:serine phosphatase RsbU (regulator of sigma subunit)
LLWHHAKTGVWDWLEDCTPYAKNVADLPLGIISGTTYAQTAVEVTPGDTLVLYTDGITESRNERGEELGHEGLLALVAGLTISPTEGPAAFGHALAAGVKKFQGKGAQRDDETLVVIQRQAEFGQFA